MKRDRFKNMMEVIRSCDDTDPIWWSGYLFIDLTEKQIKKVYSVCAARFGEVQNSTTGEYSVALPSGIDIIKRWDTEA